MQLDIDPIETQEWKDALLSVIKYEGSDRAKFILEQVLQLAEKKDIELSVASTDYKNTISKKSQPKYPGNLKLEQRLQAIIRWNATAMVVKACRKDGSLGGHIGSYASSSTLYEVGFNHFWKKNDLIYFQGHISPGIYARSFLEGVLSEEQLNNFRQEVDGKGLSSYPHPWLMPDYWQFPTVSMGLGPMQAIYQARLMHYMYNRKIIENNNRKVWCFCGDGEMDEPESLGALSVAGRENLDNLIFVINCNLQRLDGPVRGNGKIIQELESVFRGNGWNVIKVIWGEGFEKLLEKDKTGALQAKMESAVDGDFQAMVAHGGGYAREHFFDTEELKKLVAHLSDEEIENLQRGGHEPEKVYAAYDAAVNHKGQPTVILAKTVKGYGLGDAGEALNTAHNTKKMTEEQLTRFRNRFDIPVTDEQIKNLEFIKLDKTSEEYKYLISQREKLGGSLPNRNIDSGEKFKVPDLSIFNQLLQSSGDRELSTTMAFVRLIAALCKDKEIGGKVVPIVPDEARTFGMEGLFRQLGIYSPKGQLYEPVDKKQVMFYKEAKNGQILEEGINELGAFSSWLTAATSYSNHEKTLIPFYVYYSMFGFQRVGDLAWAAGDSRARGFLIGGTSGRTTLNGEGLQHEDGHSHILAGTIPNCVTYDPTFAFELAVIVQDGLKRMVQNKEDVFYYITVMNENYIHPQMPENVENGIKKGLYLYKKSDITDKNNNKKVQLLGSGSILLEIIAASEILQKEYNIETNVYSATSFNELAREARAVERINNLNPDKPKQTAYVTEVLNNAGGVVVAATDYMKQYSDQIRGFINNKYIVLGTDGFGRSDTKKKLREFFEVDRYSIVVAALNGLLQENKISSDIVVNAIKKYNLKDDVKV